MSANLDYDSVVRAATDPSPEPASPFDPVTKVRTIAQKRGIPIDVADDFLKLTGQVESGNRHYTGSGEVLRGPETTQNRGRAYGMAQVMPDKPGGKVRTIGGQQYDLTDPDQNLEAGLAYFHQGGDDPVARRLYYFGGPGARNQYLKTGKIPEGGDGYTSYKDYVRKSGGLSGKKTTATQTNPYDAIVSSATEPLTKRQQAQAAMQKAAPPTQTQPALTDIEQRLAQGDLAGAAAIARDKAFAREAAQPQPRAVEAPFVEPVVGEARPLDMEFGGMTPQDRAYISGQMQKYSQIDAVSNAAVSRMAQQRIEAAERRKAEARRQQARAAMEGGPKLSTNDAAWHLGLSPAEAQKLSLRAYQVLSGAVAEDQRKRAAGETIQPPSLEYQNQMRSKAGLRPLRFNVPTTPSSVAPYYQPEAGALPVNPAVQRGGFTLHEPTLAEQMGEAKRTAPTPSEEQSVKAAIRQQVAKENAERESAASMGSEAQLMAQRARQAGLNQPDIEAEVNKRYAAYQRSTTPEMIAARKEMGRVGAVSRTLTVPPQKFAADVISMAGGVAGLGGLTPNRVSDYLNTRAQFLTESAQLPPLSPTGEVIQRELPEKVSTALLDLGLTVFEVAALKKVSGLSMGKVMALETALKTSDQPLPERAMQVAQSYALGKILDQHLSRKASAALFGAPTGLESYAQYKEGNTSLEDAVLQTGIQAGAGFILGGKGPKELPQKAAEVGARAEITPEWLRTRVAESGGLQHIVLREKAAPGTDGESTALAPTEPVPTGRALSVYRDPADPAARKVGGTEISATDAESYSKRGIQVVDVTPEQFETALKRVNSINPEVPAELRGMPPTTPQIPETASPRSRPPVPRSAEEARAVDTAREQRQAEEARAAAPTGAAPLPEVTKTQALDAIDRANKANDGEAVKMLIATARERGATTEEIDEVLRRPSGAVTPPTPETPRVEEKPGTLVAQFESMMAGNGNRKATILPANTPSAVTAATAPLPPGVDRVIGSNGDVVVFKPSVVSKDEVKELLRTGRSNELTGAPNRETPEATLVAVARVAEGPNAGEERWSTYLEPGNEDKFRKEAIAQFPNETLSFEFGGKKIEQKIIEQRTSPAPDEEQEQQPPAVSETPPRPATQPEAVQVTASTPEKPPEAATTTASATTAPASAVKMVDTDTPALKASSKPSKQTTSATEPEQGRHANLKQVPTKEPAVTPPTAVKTQPSTTEEPETVEEMRAKATSLLAEGREIKRNIPALESYLAKASPPPDMRILMERNIANYKDRLAEVENEIGQLSTRIRMAELPPEPAVTPAPGPTKTAATESQLTTPKEVTDEVGVEEVSRPVPAATAPKLEAQRAQSVSEKEAAKEPLQLNKQGERRTAERRASSQPVEAKEERRTDTRRAAQRRSPQRIPDADWLEISPEERKKIRSQLAAEMGPPTAKEGEPLVTHEPPKHHDYVDFPPESGTLGIRRAAMPQIKSEHRGALANRLKARGIGYDFEEVLPGDLKPSQAEYSPAKVERARGWIGPERKLLVSSDNMVLDGHHQWKQKLDDAPDTPIPIIRLHAPAQEALLELAQFPSSEVDGVHNEPEKETTRVHRPTNESRATRGNAERQVEEKAAGKEESQKAAPVAGVSQQDEVKEADSAKTVRTHQGVIPEGGQVGGRGAESGGSDLHQERKERNPVKPSKEPAQRQAEDTPLETVPVVDEVTPQLAEWATRLRKVVTGLKGEPPTGERRTALQQLLSEGQRLSEQPGVQDNPAFNEAVDGLANALGVKRPQAVEEPVKEPPTEAPAPEVVLRNMAESTFVEEWTKPAANQQYPYNALLAEAQRRGYNAEGKQVSPSKGAIDTTVAREDNAERERQPARRVEPEIRGARPATHPTAPGAATTIKIPGTSRAYTGRYSVREVDDLVPSHNPQSFQPNPDYFYVNDRRYDKEAQYKKQVIDRSKSTGPEAFDPSFLINNSPTAETGPPIIDQDGNVLGGNSRAMIIHRVYASNPEAAAAYRQQLNNQAGIYGLDSQLLAAMKKPVLVRELDDQQLLASKEAQQAVTEFNVSSTTALTQEERAVSGAQQISADTADYIARKIERAGEDATLAQVMDAHGVDIINRLIDEGVFTGGERNSLLRDGKATAEAKSRIEKMLVGRVYRDLAQMEATAPVIRRNVERIVAPALKVEGSDWDIAEPLKGAIDALNEARGSSMADNLDEFQQQQSFVRPPYSDEEIALAKALQLGPRKTAEKFRAYANDYEMAAGGGGLFGAPVQSESFALHFGNGKLAVDPLFSAAEITEVPPRYALKTPIKGRTGAEIIGYHWRSREGERYSEREGGIIPSRVSNWEDPGTSTGTGRQIVHEYYVKHPDGRITIEGVGSAQKILGINETRLQAIARKEREAQRIRNQQIEDFARSYEVNAKDTAAEASQSFRQRNYSAMRSADQNDKIFDDSTLLERDGKFIRIVGPNNVAMMRERGWAEPAPPTSQLAVDPLFSTAFHGSPYDFGKFSTEKIGSGEGAASFGHGLYFTDRRGIAEHYREQNSRRHVVITTKTGEQFPVDKFYDAYFSNAQLQKEIAGKSVRDIATEYLGQANHDLTEAVSKLRRRRDISGNVFGLEWRFYDDAATALQTMADSGISISEDQKGHVYEVELAPKEDEYLLWDKPLSEQSEKVQDALVEAGYQITPNNYPSLKQAERLFRSDKVQALAREDMGIRSSLKSGWQTVQDGDFQAFRRWFDGHGGLISPRRLNDETGERFYEKLKWSKEVARDPGAEWKMNTGKDASEYLHSLGIRGIKYLDQGSRNVDEDKYEVDQQGNKFWGIQRRQTGIGFAASTVTDSSDFFDTREEAQDWVDGQNAKLPKPTYNYVIFSDDDVEITAQFAAAPDITETEAFKRWFGESKVVDKDGKPLVVYHGTQANFKKFNLKKQIQGIIWFTSNKSKIERGEVGASGKGRIMEMYASIQNPAGWAEYDKLGLYEFRSHGLDGAILPDGEGGFDGFVFKSEQLKDAHRNVGTFNPDNPNILFAESGTLQGWETAEAGPAEDPEFSIEGNHITLNNAARALMSDAYGLTRFKDRLPPNGIGGVYEKAPGALAEALDILATQQPERAEGAKALATAVREVGKQGPVTLAYGEKTRRHEGVHRVSHEASGEVAVDQRHTAEGFKRLESHPAWPTIQSALLEKRYPASLPVLVDEAFAYLATGDNLGLTDEDADSWMEAWLRSFKEKNGNPSIAKFKELSDAAEQARERIYAEGETVDRGADSSVQSVSDQRAEGTPRAHEESAGREPWQQPRAASGLTENEHRLVVAQAINTGKDVPAKVLEEYPGLAEGIRFEHAQIADAALTDTEAFKQWFRDSKVVDRSGNPKVVYHYSPSTFTEFDPDRILDFGFHFGSKDQAKSMPSQKIKGGPTYEVYLSIQNPLRLPDLDTWRPNEIVEELRRRKLIDSSEEFLVSDSRDPHKELREILQARGYDGVVYRNDVEGRRRGGDSYIAFEPTQIKSTQNRGTFDPNDPSMLFAEHEDPWAHLLKLAEDIQRPEGQKARQLPKTFEAAEMETGTNFFYPPTTIPTGIEIGKQTVAEKGIDGAIEFVKTGDGIGWASTGYEVLAQLRADEANARKTDAAAADAIAEKRLQFLDDFVERSTELGRAIVGIKAIEMFAPDRAAYHLNKLSQKRRKHGISKEEEARIHEMSLELARVNDELKAAQASIDYRIEVARSLEEDLAAAEARARRREKYKPGEGKEQVPRKARQYDTELKDRASTIKDELLARVGNFNFGNLKIESRFPGQEGKVGDIKPLPGDAELLAEYTASQLATHDTVADLNKHLLDTFGQEVEPYLSAIRQRAFQIRKDARTAEMANRETDEKRSRTILGEIQKEISAGQKAVKDLERAHVTAEKERKKAEKAAAQEAERSARRVERAEAKAGEKELREEARRQAKATRTQEREARLAEIKEARARLKETRKEYQQASEAETKGWRATSKAQREAARTAGLWDTPIRRAAAEARARLATATDAKDPLVMEDLAAVAAAKFIPDEPGGPVRKKAVFPSKVRLELMDEFPSLITRQNADEVYRRGYQRILDMEAAAREAARLRSASKESQQLWEKMGVDTEAQALLIQRATKRRQQQELRHKMTEEFERVSRSRTANFFFELNAFPRSAKSSIDAPELRQGLFAFLTHPQAMFRTLTAAGKGYTAIHPADYHALVEELQRMPRYELAKTAGMDLPEIIGDVSDPRVHGEEYFQSGWGQKVPHIRVSEQAYVLSMNTKRMTLFNLLAPAGEAHGYTWENNPEFFKQVASFINDVTGRGNVPESMARFMSTWLNWFFFAPRYNVSKVQLLNDLFNPLKYISAEWAPETPGLKQLSSVVKELQGGLPGSSAYDPIMRKIAAEHVIRWFGALLALLLVAKLLGFSITFDPEDADAFPKMRWGNTSYDFSGGEIGTIRFLYRFLKGIAKMSTGHKVSDFENPGAIAKQFMRQKLSPWVGGFVDWLTGTDAVGQPSTIKTPVGWYKQGAVKTLQEDILVKMIEPIVVGDFLDGATDSGWLGVAKTVPALLGLGVQTYPRKEKPSSTQKLIYEKLAEQRDQTPQEKERSQLMRKLEEDVRQGKPVTTEIDAAVKTGKLRPDDRDEIVRSAQLTPTQLAFKQLGITAAMDVYADPALPATDKAALKDLLISKGSTIENLPEPEQDAAEARFESLTGEKPKTRRQQRRESGHRRSPHWFEELKRTENASPIPTP